MKKISLELGGNAPYIIFDDADLKAAVKGIMSAKFRNAGQVCIAANRIYVQSKVYDQVAQRLHGEVSKLKVGHGLEPGVEIGPLRSKSAMHKVQSHLADALQKGASTLIGGVGHVKGGLFYNPTVVVDVHPESLLCHQETFGPLAALIRFETEEEVIELANATPYGLAGYFYSQDVSRVFRVAEALKVGMVGVNEGKFLIEKNHSNSGYLT